MMNTYNNLLLKQVLLHKLYKTFIQPLQNQNAALLLEQKKSYIYKHLDINSKTYFKYAATA